MGLGRDISDIESCTDVSQLKRKLQLIAENFGFSGYDFVDAGNPHNDVPFHLGTSGKSWEREYVSNGFIHHDPMVSLVRRRNTPFTWNDVVLPEQVNRNRPMALKLMDAAHDHGFENGLVIPVHFRDAIGGFHSCSSVFFWKDKPADFEAIISANKHDITLIMIYWIQRVVDIGAKNQRGKVPTCSTDSALQIKATITSRERDVLTWAARGKTSSETADILCISTKTVNTHISHALRKFDVSNKTQAVVRAIYIGLIDV